MNIFGQGFSALGSHRRFAADRFMNAVKPSFFMMPVSDAQGGRFPDGSVPAPAMATDKTRVPRADWLGQPIRENGLWPFDSAGRSGRPFGTVIQSGPVDPFQSGTGVIL